MAKRKRTLTLKKRVAKLGAGINNRAENQGDEHVPAFDIPLSGIMIDADEFAAITGDPKAYDHVFVKGKRGEPDEPASLFRLCKPISLRDKFTDCAAIFSLGADVVIEVDEAKIGRLRFEPQTGGLLAMSCQVQCTPEPSALSPLYGFLKDAVDVKLVFGAKEERAKEKQPELPMAGGGNGDEKTPLEDADREEEEDELDDAA